MPRLDDLLQRMSFSPEKMQGWHISMSMLNEYISYSVPAVLLFLIILIHYTYYRWNRHTDGQHVFDLHDFTNMGFTNMGGGHSSSQRGALSVFEASGVAFDAEERTQVNCRLPIMNDMQGNNRGIQRYSQSQTFWDGYCTQEMVLSEDMIVDGSAIFERSVKVGGDLIINGNATFNQIAIINGDLHIVGTAHFAAGLIVKRDAMVTGTITIGSLQAPGWAIVREFVLRRRLLLNGRIISHETIDMNKVA